MARKGKWDPQRKGGRRRQAHFMDAAMDGYVRDVALRCWRAFEDLSEAYPDDLERALADAGAFHGAGGYRALWLAAWQKHVWPGPEDRSAPLFGRVEAAVREALTSEIEARRERGDVTVEDTTGYNEFVDRALNRLFEEAGGEIEESL